MENLVGVRIADTAQQMWIGEGTLERVVFFLKRSRKRCDVAGHHFESAGIEGCKRVLTLHHVQRSALSGRRLCHKQRTFCKIERRKSNFPGYRGAAVAPLEPAGDHEMEHEKYFSVHLPHDPLSDAAKSDNHAAERLLERGLDRAQKKWCRQPYALQPLADNARAEGGEIQLDVGKL